MNNETAHVRRGFSRIAFVFLLLATILGSLPLLLVDMFRWTLIDLLTPFFVPFLELIGYIVFIISLLISLVYLLTSKPLQRKRRSIPLVINLVVLAAVLFVPFTAITLQLDFSINQLKREEVVQKVLDRSLSPNVSHHASLIRLPQEYRKLSKGGGEIVVEEDGETCQILFYSYRGVVDNYAGFVYTSDGSEPRESDFGEFIEVKKLEQNWFWISAT